MGEPQLMWDEHFSQIESVYGEARFALLRTALGRLRPARQAGRLSRVY